MNATKQPQDGFVEPSESREGGMQTQNRKLKVELKVAYSELAELKQTLAMKDRKIANLQSRNTVLTVEQQSKGNEDGARYQLQL